MSIPCGKSELLLFEPPATQVCMRKAMWVDVHPLNSVNESSGPIQFSITGSDDSYIDLNDTLLYIRCKVSAENATKQPAAGEVAPVNLMLSSLFSDVEVHLGDRQIEGGDHLYAYKSYISNLLNYDSSMKKTQLRAAGFIKDAAGKFDDKTNPSHKERSNWISSNQSLELCGALNVSFLQQSKYLLPKVNVRIKMTRNKTQFCLMNFSEHPVKLEIEDAVLYVRRVTLTPAIVQAHSDGLRNHNALYPIQKSVVTNYTISKGAMSDSREILVGSEIPKLLVVGLVDNVAFNGHYKKNPFNFQHFKLNFISLLKNGEPIPAPPLQLDFTKQQYMRAYMGMINNLEYYIRDESNAITPKDFANGSALFVFNLTPDLSFGGHCAQQFETSNVRLDLKFASALDHSINVILYSIYDSQIEITKDRTVWQW